MAGAGPSKIASASAGRSTVTTESGYLRRTRSASEARPNAGYLRRTGVPPRDLQAAATRTRHDRYPPFVHRASAAVQHSTPPIRANPRACLAGRRACFPLEGEVRSRVPGGRKQERGGRGADVCSWANARAAGSSGSLAGRTGLDRQQAVGDLPIFRWRLLERAEPASTKRRLLLHLRLSGSLAAAREQVAASPHEHKRCRRRGPLSQCRRRAEERQPDSHPPRVSAPPCYCG